MSESENGKRPYTMSEAALAQRRAAAPAAHAAATGPITEEGKAASSRNGWKDGRYSMIHKAPVWMQMSLGSRGRPCVSTCEKHPCSLVKDGLTEPGKDCLDMTVYVTAFEAIMNLLHSGDVRYVHGLHAAKLSQAIDVMNRLYQDIVNNGAMVPRYMTNLKTGEPIKDKDDNLIVMGYSINPAISQFVALLDKLGINFPEMMATPKAISKLEDTENAVSAIHAMVGKALSRVNGDGPVKRGRVIEQRAEGDPAP